MDYREGVGGDPSSCLLSFSLGPVQSFIASARSVRDLWTGSYLLSWLAFRAMQPLLGRYGPDALVTPPPRGKLPLEPGDRLDRDRPSACLPNRFLAIVPDDPGAIRTRQIAS